jgi:hypothetical protein
MKSYTVNIAGHQYKILRSLEPLAACDDGREADCHIDHELLVVWLSPKLAGRFGRSERVVAFAVSMAWSERLEIGAGRSGRPLRWRSRTRTSRRRRTD